MKLGTLVLACAAVFSMTLPHAIYATTLPQRPHAVVNTTYPTPTGQTIFVASGGDLQAAIDSAQPGDVVSIEAGATFTGNFILRAKSGTGYVIIRTATPDDQLPPQGTRITPNQVSLLPKLVTPNGNPALATRNGANHYWLLGIEVEYGGPDSAENYGLVQFGSATQTSLASVPHDLVIDRCYIHGSATNMVRRGVTLNSATSAVVDSYISEIHEPGRDTQAIEGWNGPGPFTIANNYLEAAGENVMFGGAVPSITNLVPSDITITHNHVAKQLSWGDGHWLVRNLFELTNAQRVLVDGNIFERNWKLDQDGTAIVFAVDQTNQAPWSVVQDVTFTRNVVQHVGAGVHFSDAYRTEPAEDRLLVQNNLLVDVGAPWSGTNLAGNPDSASAIMFHFGASESGFTGIGPGNLTIDHNTGLQAYPAAPVAGGGAAAALTFTNNLVENGAGGFGGRGNVSATISSDFPDIVMQANAFIGGRATDGYPSGTLFPPDDASVGFVDQANGDYSLTASSPYHNAATDGQALGVDWTALQNAVAGVLDGTGG